MKTVMGYVYALSNYLRTDKGRHDLIDYVRAIIIMGAVMAMVRVLWDMLLIKGMLIFAK